MLQGYFDSMEDVHCSHCGYVLQTGQVVYEDCCGEKNMLMISLACMMPGFP